MENCMCNKMGVLIFSCPGGSEDNIEEVANQISGGKVEKDISCNSDGCCGN